MIKNFSVLKEIERSYRVLWKTTHLRHITVKFKNTEDKVKILKADSIKEHKSDGASQFLTATRVEVENKVTFSKLYGSELFSFNFISIQTII